MPGAEVRLHWLVLADMGLDLASKEPGSGASRQAARLAYVFFGTKGIPAGQTGRQKLSQSGIARQVRARSEPRLQSLSNFLMNHNALKNKIKCIFSRG
jgi:hypothetical protein